MTFDAILTQVLDLLQREKRVSYRALKRRFDLDDNYLEDVKDELIYAKKLAVDEDNRVLVWTGDQAAASAPPPVPGPPALAVTPAPDHEREPLSYTPRHLAERILTSRSALEGERKQVTVLFCDLANSTPLAELLGPEAMYGLLDGFLALFGAPLAREDHARRAVLAALGIQQALRERLAGLARRSGEDLDVRMGINTGLVVVGKIGDNLRMDYTAVGDTTHVASRLEQLAEPGNILISEAPHRLVRGYARVEDLGDRSVRGKTDR